MALTLLAQFPWTQRPLIVSAPMRGSAGPKLAASVSKAGGLGFIGGVANKEKDSSMLAEARKLLQGTEAAKHAELPIGFGSLCFLSDLDDTAAVVQEHKPSVIWLFSVHELKDFATWTDKMRSVSAARIWIQTGSVADAVEIARTCKPDTLVIQGIDAGGHGADKGASIISLLPEVADALAAEGFGDIPLIAAGGIVDHRGVAAAFALGGAGVCMGTRFLASDEVTLAHPAWREHILAATDGGQSTLKARVFDDMNTSLTWPSWFDGRALRNHTSRDWEKGLSMEENRKLFAAAGKKDHKGYAQSEPRATVWAGTGVGLVREVLPAGQIVEQTRAAATKLLKGMSSIL